MRYTRTGLQRKQLLFVFVALFFNEAIYTNTNSVFSYGEELPWKTLNEKHVNDSKLT